MNVSESPARGKSGADHGSRSRTGFASGVSDQVSVVATPDAQGPEAVLELGMRLRRDSTISRTIDPERSSEDMASSPADRDLLFGMLAVQMKLIDRAELIESLQEWANDTTRHALTRSSWPRDSLTAEESTVVEAVVAEKLQQDCDLAETRLDGAFGPGCRGAAREPGHRRRGIEIVGEHAKGGLGEVFLAEDTELHRRVALKEIQARHAQNPVSRERFVAEAEITGNLEHPGIVPVYGLGTHADGRPFYAMRFIKGEDLATAIRRFHTSGPAEFCRARVPLAASQARSTFVTRSRTAHSRGVLHRDLEAGQYHDRTVRRDAGDGLGRRQADRTTVTDGDDHRRRDGGRAMRARHPVRARHGARRR